MHLHPEIARRARPGPVILLRSVAPHDGHVCCQMAQFVPANGEVEARATLFFGECHDLRDWLTSDIANLPGITTRNVVNHTRVSRPLQIASAVANSHKHHTRSHGTTARIRETYMTPEGARVVIESDWGLPTAANDDALELADACIADWREFFRNHGISET